ncbi:MAG: hypothetical protein NZZ41_00535 [Candidatus Dojkabacteria bacterium]|nr:hypothetical protein [Candidatus Dojkabacteria bacterium]
MSEFKNFFIGDLLTKNKYIKMLIKEILLEYNLQNLLSLFSEKYELIQRRDFSNKHKTLENFLKSIEDFLRKENKFQFIDPYVKWIVQKYVTNNLGLYEDILGKVIPGLLRYDSLKRKNKLKSEHKDINQIKNINQLLDILDEYKEEETKSISEKEKEIEQNFYKNGEAILIYNDNNLKVVVPKSKAASCFFGRNTRWCTAASTSKNYFNFYNKKGPLYIILDKKKNKRFQFHFETKQFMDEKDQPIRIEDFKTNYPILSNIFREIEKKNYKTKVFYDISELTSSDIARMLTDTWTMSISDYALSILKKDSSFIDDIFIKTFYKTLKSKKHNDEKSVSFRKFLGFLLEGDTTIKQEQEDLFLRLFFTDGDFINELIKNSNFLSQILKKYEHFFKKEEIKEKIKKISLDAYLKIYLYEYDSSRKSEIEKIVNDNELLSTPALQFYVIKTSIFRDMFVDNLDIFIKFCENLLKWNDTYLINKYIELIFSVYDEYNKKRVNSQKLDKIFSELLKISFNTSHKEKIFQQVKDMEFFRKNFESIFFDLLKDFKFMLLFDYDFSKNEFFRILKKAAKTPEMFDNILGIVDIVKVFMKINREKKFTKKEKFSFIDTLFKMNPNFHNNVLKNIVEANEKENVFEDLFKTDTFKDYLKNKIFVGDHKNKINPYYINYFNQ